MEKRVMTVADVMTRELVTLYEEEDVTRIEEAMERHRFHHLPVVDGKKLVGLLTHRDLLRFDSSVREGAAAQRTQERAGRTFVRDIMQRDVETVRPETPLVEAATRMRDENIGCLPVVNDEGELVGMLTSRDLLDLAVRWLGGPASKRPFAEG
jgi:CBS domain-containing membrane protein